MITAVFAGYFAFVPHALADPTPAQTAGQNTTGLFGTVLNLVLGWPLDKVASSLIDGIVALAELARDAIFLGPVLIVSILFEYAVWFNVTKSILNVAAVGQAWGVMQGLANMFFILVLLWIALATIFDFEEYTAKNLLPKLIIMALLINFSLVITGIVVDFSNGLGYYFYQQLRGGGLLFTQIMNNLSVSQLFDYRNQSPGGATVAQREQKISPTVDPFKATGLNPVDPKLQSAVDTQKKKMAGTLYSPGQSTLAALSRLAALIITTFLGIILIVVLLFGIGFLIARQVSIMFLGIFSPLVFLANIMPQTREHWNRWWTDLTQKAFFAPVYLFCLLATFKFLELAKQNIFTENSAAGLAGFAKVDTFDVGFLFLYFLAAAMMIASLIVAQKMSIALGGTAVGLAQKTGGYIKTGFKEQGAKMAAGSADKFLKSGAGAAMARMPLLRTIPQAAVQIQAAEAKRAKERADLYAKLSPQDLARDFNKYSTTEQNALAKTLDENQKSKTLNEMLKNNSFEGLNNDIQKGLLSGVKEFIPEAELAARGAKTTEADYGDKMGKLITEKSRELRTIRPDSLDNAHVRDALKRVGAPKDWENLASTMKGAGKMVDIWQGDVQKAASRGQTISQAIQQDYGNTELANYANTNPLFKKIIAGQIVRPQGKQKGQRGQQQPPQTPPPAAPPTTPVAPPPTPASPRGTPTGRPSATYAPPPPPTPPPTSPLNP